MIGRSAPVIRAKSRDLVRVVAMVQARMGSTRLPGKVVAPLGGRPMLEHVLLRAKAIPGVSQVLLLTTRLPEDTPLVVVAAAVNVQTVRGPEHDVLERYHMASKWFDADVVVRITADCPLLDPDVSGMVLRAFIANIGQLDYVSNCHPHTWPDGLDTEVVSATALHRAWMETRNPFDREHVTPYIWQHPGLFHCHNVVNVTDQSYLRWTVDTPEDLAFMQSVYRECGAGRSPGLRWSGPTTAQVHAYQSKEA